MCNEVCYCCEKDICNCSNVPQMDLKELIIYVFKNNTKKPYKTLNIGKYNPTTFYLETYKRTPVTVQMKKFHKEIHNKILELGYELDHTSKSVNCLYSFFSYK